MSGCPLENCRNRGHTQNPPPRGRSRALTALSFMTTVNRNITDSHKAAPILCQAIPQVVFHPDALVFSPSVLMRGAEWPTLPSGAKTSHVAQSLTNTFDHKTATPAAVGSRKINSNCAWPTDDQIMSPIPPGKTHSDVMSAASFWGSDGDSEYCESAKNSPSRLANIPDITGHIIKL